MARQTCRTNWEQARVQAVALLAQGGRTGGGRSRETAAVSVPLEEEEHMNRYIHTIPCPTAQSQTGCRGVQASLERVLEGMAYQNQLLSDLLGSVNALTAVLLSIQNRKMNS